MRSKGAHYSLALLLSMGAFGLSGCGGGDGDSARVEQTVDASKNGVIKTEIAENEGYVHIKGSTQFNLIGIDAKGKEINLNNKATWTLSDKSLGTVKNGLVTSAGVAGNVELHADYAGIRQTQPLIITAANLLSISIDEGTSEGDECKNATFTAKAHFEQDLVLEYPLTWVITEGAALASFSDPTKGIMSTKNSGAVKVIAQAQNNAGELIKSEPASYTIQDTLVSLNVASDKNPEMREGDTATISVIGTYSSNSTTTDITSNTTLSADPASAIKFEGNKITAQNGTPDGVDVLLTGTCGGVEDNLELVVKEKELRSIQIKNTNGGTEDLTITEGSSMDLNITATYIDNSTNSNYTYQVHWEIDEERSDNFDDSMITINQDGVLNVNTDLNLLQQIEIVVVAEVRDENGDVETNPLGQDLADDIDIRVQSD